MEITPEIQAEIDTAGRKGYEQGYTQGRFDEAAQSKSNTDLAVYMHLNSTAEEPSLTDSDTTTPSPMTLEQKKEECGRYYAATSLKEISEDVTIYGTTPSAGVRHLPLGYFPTEEDAVDALHSYLTNNNLI